MKRIITILSIFMILFVLGCNNMEKKSGLNLKEAISIAKSSACSKEGKIVENGFHNNYTNTWWIEFTPNEKKQGCMPACVVREITKTAEINWRCTGLIE